MSFLPISCRHLLLTYNNVAIIILYISRGRGGAKPSVPPPPTAKRPAGPKCKALYDYEARDADELTIHEGDVIDLINEGSLMLCEITDKQLRTQENLNIQKTFADFFFWNFSFGLRLFRLLAREVVARCFLVIKCNERSLVIIRYFLLSRSLCVYSLSAEWLASGWRRKYIIVNFFYILSLSTYVADPSGWWRGQLGRKTGLFPANFTTKI